MNQENIQILDENFTTKHLLSLFRQTRAYGGVLDCWGGSMCHLFGVGAEITDDEIKEVLARREHIPNKKEGEVLRRKKQKTSRDARDRRYVR